ncbi:MAG: GTP-binding protein [Thermobacillus sp. ZCTH02-B1]|uniref:putative glycoside hydrolase n=1 Tax=Thermobacillus sp. ZCTH02-B1 TaxID=1858795 RepID=UPI000B55E742|nr:putative glycoside hydrolase [Thermobacillus sp. ZCTH02-B1]OUM94464.1 MAG: GTP-binding protein [Thermobacillus sp. ZCTH02-B1]
MDILLVILLLLHGMLSGADPYDGLTDASPRGGGGNAVADAPGTSAPGSGPEAPEAGAGSSDPAADPRGGTTRVKIDPQPDAPKVKGIYVTAHSAGGSRMEELLELVRSTDLNAMVIDVKDDWGYITWPADNPELAELGTTKKIIRDMEALLNRLREENVYPIARIVVFKDSVLAGKRPDLSFRKADGTVWKNGRGESFVNPYRREVWEYNVAVAREAAKLGFKEIQFDYVRFPEGFEKRADELLYDRTEESRIDVVSGFVEYAKKELEPLGVRVSVDIFGYAASVPAAEGIGQDFVRISEHVDVISPMVYPSHYSTGWFGLKDPDKEPYATIRGAMEDTHEKLEQLGDLKPIIRPWIQDFTATWLGKGHYIPYGKAEVEAQIQALADTGIKEFMIWNAGNKYTAGVRYDLLD